MKKCVILSMDDTQGFEVYDHLLEQPLKQAGWMNETISWRKPGVTWDDYDLVMIRSPWDYQLDSDKFLQVLETIENSKAHLDNPLSIVRWNINKKYLLELENKGIEIVPTLWKDNIQNENVADYFSQLNAQELVIKPCISAGAADTFRINKQNLASHSEILAKTFQQREYMVQPFVEEIISEGEFSVFYFDDDYSHTILKTPKENDFRVQEEHGGFLLKIQPEELLLQHAEKVLLQITESLLYARLDFVRTKTGFALMEAELIEPSLYFNLDADAPQRFVNAIEKRMERFAERVSRVYN